jgi:hypothetical protein
VALTRNRLVKHQIEFMRFFVGKKLYSIGVEQP